MQDLNATFLKDHCGKNQSIDKSFHRRALTPKGLPSRAPHTVYVTIGTEPCACTETENHATLSSWSTRLVTWITDTCNRH